MNPNRPPAALPQPLSGGAGQRWRLADAAATRALGHDLAALLLAARSRPQGEGSPPALLLQGELGAGKTSLVQGIAAGLGIGEPITSPTFALAQHYSGVLPDGTPTALVHLDLYRLEQAAAAEELFAQEEELAAELGALLAVEWPGRLCTLPPKAWLLELELADAADPEAGRIAALRRVGGLNRPG